MKSIDNMEAIFAILFECQWSQVCKEQYWIDDNHFDNDSYPDESDSCGFSFVMVDL